MKRSRCRQRVHLHVLHVLPDLCRKSMLLLMLYLDSGLSKHLQLCRLPVQQNE